MRDGTTAERRGEGWTTAYGYVTNYAGVKSVTNALGKVGQYGYDALYLKSTRDVTDYVQPSEYTAIQTRF